MCKVKVGDKVRLTLDPDYLDDELLAQLKAANCTVGVVVSVAEDTSLRVGPGGSTVEKSTGFFNCLVYFDGLPPDEGETEEDAGLMNLLDLEIELVSAVEQLGDLVP